MVKNIKYEYVEITDFAAEGKCIFKSDDGVIFVEGNVAPGDIVDLQVVKTKKKLKEAIVTKIHSKSPLRTDPYCLHNVVCGGCKWQHIAYEHQLKFKRQQVVDHFQRIGHIKNVSINEILAAPKTEYYRNKLEFTFSNWRWLTKEQMDSGATFTKHALGFHVPKRFDKIFTVDHCHLQPDPSNTIRNSLHHFGELHNIPYYDVRFNRGTLRNLVVRTANSGDVMVIVQFGEQNDEAIEQVMQYLHKTHSEITSLNYIVNLKGNDSYQDQEVIHYAGDTTIRETMEDLTFLVGPKSFYQTNSEQAYQLFSVAREFAGLTGNESVYDLYTGTGTIANFVARRAKKVVGVEYVEAAVQDARKNSELNGITNTAFFAGDMRSIMNESFLQEHGRPDVIITDPPRAGMDQPVVETILKAAPDRIVYVSCNTATQARDLALMTEDYEVTKVQPVDMFPNTHHVENVALLVRRPGLRLRSV
ncbi:23S rRNA (uracil(1939)-C(5))-methyltransferase RlmD [Dyadobacter chenhuakuii]|uniref:23S rRNA (Uracil(1939)-C(5))-methyltransferase RlmD n=1 Tax=Dyadobacter chenhuakuii TaxID=2909339 RepID=A0A9X1QCC8_9BACT|nr:23S rRNA (uracil(1939)-C(5))-methyltransferase RlmD [Dyadobacter chenhuakuii]MCF2497808.1 23S rRNA (uracil(1939)-C(5))-methyltransferase RlmD [Dyadobacter chenhuakuii]